MNTITSKSGTIYYDYVYDDDDVQVESNKKYYIQNLKYKIYYVGDPKNEIFVSWYDYYEVDQNGKLTNTKIQVDTSYTVVTNKNTDETKKNLSLDEVKEYINSFTQKQLEEQTDNSTEEFVNTTGHTEQTDEDLEEYTGASIFDESNIIEEDTFGVKFSNDEYHQGDDTDLNSKIKDTVALEDTTTLAVSSVQNAEDDDTIKAVNDEISIDDDGNKKRKSTLEAAIGLASGVDQFGHYLLKGGTCPVCGKHIDFMPGNGYCSLTCAAKDLLKKITQTLKGEYEVETPEIIERIKNILDYFNLVLNVVSKVPDILAGTASMPEEYRNYVTAKVNIVFLELKKIINLLLIKKDELIIKLLRRIKFGTIDAKLSPLFAVINQVIKAVQLAKDALEKALAAAYNTINKVSGLFYIGPQEYGFFFTLKSNMAMCPFYKTDPTVYKAGQLGKPFWGMGVMNIAFDMSKCQFKLDTGMKSALQNVDFQKINKIVRKYFKPITAPEYLMDPELFDVRLALSDQNAPAIEKLVRLLEGTIVIGGDFLPTYERLKLTNIWFIVAILTTWAPTTRSIFGDFIFHGFL